MNTKELLAALLKGGLDKSLTVLYGKEHLAAARLRCERAIHSFEGCFGPREEAFLLSVPGRSEIAGNHTDHQRGRVIATSVNLDILAVAAKTVEPVATVCSEGYGTDTVVLSESATPDPAHYGKSSALVAGMCHGLLKKGANVGGFMAYLTSDVPAGSGLSSSAAFEVMIGNIENHLYNGGLLNNAEIAKVAGYAENVFFGKPCGLMDQMACAVGGIIAIDFENEQAPKVTQIDFDPTAENLCLCIVNTGGSHADLTPDYTAIPTEMKAVAEAFGAPVLRETSEEDFLAALPNLREKVGDRALLRALHFFAENRRATAVAEALKTGDVSHFLALINESGRSSFCYLQNVYTARREREQGLSLALCLTERYLADKQGAFRVHGGGFAGTIQAFLKEKDVPAYRHWMDAVFGTGACRVLQVRPIGATAIL